ncbi:MAG: ATP-binding cassette domain-containing protein [Solirubrobacteraceae bacterium]
MSGLDLEVRQGEVFGFLGPNGAGKSTTMRLLLNLIKPTSAQRWCSGWTQSVRVSRSSGGLAFCRVIWRCIRS